MCIIGVCQILGLKTQSGDGNYVGNNKVRQSHNALASESRRMSIGASKSYPDSQIFVPSMVNGEVVLPLSPDMDMGMPSTPLSETFGRM